MKPIAQTFYVNEPENGVAGVHLTSIELFFKSKSPTFGVQVQIRTTDNGNPTRNTLPFADVQLPSSSVNVSDDASVGTRFKFRCPVFLQAATSYSIIIIPLGSNPDYQIWTAELAPGTVDVTTNTPIKTNNDTGTLFLSSNDIQFTSIQTEDIKFILYVADFKSTTGRAVFHAANSDYGILKEKIGNFIPREKVVISNNSYDLARLTVTSNTAAFINGEVIFQTNSTSANIATGIIHSANTTSINITNSTGTWVTSRQVKGLASNANAVISAAFQNVVTTAESNTITVPFSNIFSAGQMIYVGNNNRLVMQPAFVNSVIDVATIKLNSNIVFSESASLFGRIRGDGKLFAGATSVSDNDSNDRITIILDNISGNTTMNFADSKNQYLIGTLSGTSARVITVFDSEYNAIVPQFAESIPSDTDIKWSFSGVAADNARTLDTVEIPIVNNVEKELYDTPRTLMSRSNELAKLSGNRKGSFTSSVYADFSTANSMISPVIDVGAKAVVTTISNSIVPQEKLTGYRLLIENNPFSVGDIVKQQNANSTFSGGIPYVFGEGRVFKADDTQVLVTNVNGYFNSANSIMLSSDTNINAFVTDSNWFRESSNYNIRYSSRYISKSVILAEGQDAEDIKVYLTAYRPAGTDFLVYGKFQNGEDPDPFKNKNWTLLKQISSPSLLSSFANINDFVELEYGLPKSYRIARDSSNCNINDETMRVNAIAVQKIDVGSFVYVADTTSDKFFVGKVRKIVNTNLIMLTDKPPFSIANGEFGVIRNLETTAGAFVYTANNNVMRYVSADKVVYDTYKTFAIKIVPISTSTAVVPRARDLRAIALQV